MNELPSSVTFCLDSDCAISIIESKNHILKPYLANRRAIVKGKLQEWQQKYPEIDIKPLQLIVGNLNPADLPTMRYCTAKEVENDTPWQNGLSFLMLPRDQWPVSRAFKMKIPDD